MTSLTERALNNKIPNKGTLLWTFFPYEVSSCV